jgi:glyoxylase-like metal-dependent hydrolase (beta-lactamase superfamily II)
MIHVEQQGSVLAIRMSRSFFGRPFWWTTAYWVDGLLIDTGPRFAARYLCQALQKVTVNQIVITHAHENQIGGLPALLQCFPGAKIYVSRRTAPLLQEPPVTNLHLYRKLLWGKPHPWTGPVEIIDEVSDRIATDAYVFHVLETPGHTPDHIALFEPTQRWLFSGDIYQHGQDEAWVTEADLFGVICSLRTLASLHPERLFAADGRISRTPLPELHGKIGRLVQLAREVARMDALGLTVDEMVLRLFQKEPPIHFWTTGHYSARHLVAACRSYNALFTAHPAEQPRAHRPTPTQSTDEEDSSDSSNWPIDWGDLIR